MPIVNIVESAWNRIMEIQEEAYSELFPEEEHVLKSKWLLSPDTCFVFTDDDNKILGYLLSHPWALDTPPKLNEAAYSAGNTSNLYLHDLALSLDARGKGIAGSMVKRLLAQAKQQGFVKVLLVAVQDSSSFWGKFGFVEVENIMACPSYGDSAVLMSLVFNTDS